MILTVARLAVDIQCESGVAGAEEAARCVLAPLRTHCRTLRTLVDVWNRYSIQHTLASLEHFKLPHFEIPPVQTTVWETFQTVSTTIELVASSSKTGGRRVLALPSPSASEPLDWTHLRTPSGCQRGGIQGCRNRRSCRRSSRSAARSHLSDPSTRSRLFIGIEHGNLKKNILHENGDLNFLPRAIASLTSARSGVSVESVSGSTAASEGSDGVAAELITGRR